MDLRAMATAGIDAYNARDVDGMRYADDVVGSWHMGAEPIVYRGRVEVIGHWQREWLGWPDAHVTVHRVLVDGDTSVVEFTWSATNTGPLSLDAGVQVPPTGKHVEMRGVSISTVRGGRIVAVDNYWDDLSIMIQMGMLADPMGAMTPPPA